MESDKKKIKPSKKKSLVMIVGLVTILCLSAGGYVVFSSLNKSNNKDSASSSQTTQQQSTTTDKVATADVVADGSTTNDIAYASVSSAQKLDLYLPSSGKTSYPVVVYIHGGAFISGDKASSIDMSTINQIVAHGYAVASINYRLSSEAKYPAQINDAKLQSGGLRQMQLNID